MNRNFLKQIKLIVTLAAVFLSIRVSEACATCFGSPGSTITLAIGNAIVFLLIMVGTVLLGIVSFFCYLAFKAKKFREHEDIMAQKGLKNA